LPAPEQAFPHICQGDFFEDRECFTAADIVLLNPPFGRVATPEGVSWSTGQVTAAAVFTETAFERLGSETHLSAILPDVLRSGSRYRAWRERAEELVSVDTVEPVGQFDAATDVDVFVLRASPGDRAGNAAWWPSPPGGTRIVEDYFHVTVGAVVPHRDAEVGPETPYIYPRLLPAGETYAAADVRRRSGGPTVTPPFVAIRRTCRPVDRGPRVLATIVSGTEGVAVENHLIVAKPHSGELRECEDLMMMLRSQATTDWLDQRIRCRHLTVGAVRQLPWPQPQT
jgi:hypothetical protein